MLAAHLEVNPVFATDSVIYYNAFYTFRARYFSAGSSLQQTQVTNSPQKTIIN